MALSYKARRRWSLVILLIGLPLYIVAAVTVVNWFDRPPIWLEFVVYVALGIIWALPKLTTAVPAPLAGIAIQMRG